MPPHTEATRADDGTLPLGSYGAVGDGRSVAVVGADGSIDWWAVPSLDAPPLFDRLLDPARGGRFAITPEGAFTVERRYRRDSNVLEQVFTTPGGRVRITDSLNSGISGRLPWSELARRVEGLDGAVDLAVTMSFGRRLDKANPWREATGNGGVIHLDGIVAALRWGKGVEVVEDGDDRFSARLSVTAGMRTTLALVAAEDEILVLPSMETIDARIDRSDEAWREWANNLSYAGPYRDAVRRSALALKLLLFSPTGAIAAAATTSLPERVGGNKNYDYRFAWIRDASFTIKAFLRLDAVEEAQAAFTWMMRTVARHGGLPSVMYTLDGDEAPEQTELDLPGYRASRPVLSGNTARSQLQLGIYGDLFETAARFVARGHVLDLPTRHLLAGLADRCCDIWRQADTGIWELGETQHYTMSKMGCWIALDRAVHLAQEEQIERSRAGRWARERDRLFAWIEAHCWSKARNAYTMYAGTEKLDASLLLAARIGFPNAQRMSATIDAIRAELARGPLLFRYTGMEAEEGTFTACGFWLVEALAHAGRHDDATAQMDAMLGATQGDIGVMTEQVDPTDNTMLGNLPQALSHLALVHAAVILEDTRPG